LSQEETDRSLIVVLTVLNRTAGLGVDGKSASTAADAAERAGRSMALESSHEPTTANPWPTFALRSVAVFLVLLDTTILFVACHGIQSSFAARRMPSARGYSTHTIVLDMLLVPAGRLVDWYRRQRLFLVGVALFTRASGLCGRAMSAVALIGFRVLHAAGAALLMPASSWASVA
jgi:hypothetical protein